MNKITILKKAIEKAVKGGWNTSEWFKNNTGKRNTPELIIFSHNFAKAFWGIWESKDGCKDNEYLNATNERWQYHLQKLVLEKEPLKYLEKFL